MTLQRHIELKEKIIAKGLLAEEKKHCAYYYKLYRKNVITKEQFLYNYHSVLEILGN